MADLEFPSTFDLSSLSSVIFTPSEGSSSLPLSEPEVQDSSFASFACHTIFLERKLRGDSPLVLGNGAVIKKTGKILGQGKTFHVEHAQWFKDPKGSPVDVAVKEIVAEDSKFSSYHSTSGIRTNWKDILLEIRALLHEPLRYHPNIVHILGLQWGASSITESMYPVLIMECSNIGSLRKLQSSVDPLPFSIKQKLCYDVARGLSALHACGIVHGDMKHENVLIFLNRDKNLQDIPYTAKLADFGGSIMDMGPNDRRQPEPGTWPFQAPEFREKLTRDGLKQTDTYSFGLLIWRAFTDAKGFVSLPGAAPDSEEEEKIALQNRKSKPDFICTATFEWMAYTDTHNLGKEALELGIYVLTQCLSLEPSRRSLIRVQAALRGVSLGKMGRFLGLVEKKNREWDKMMAEKVPGTHGLTQDGLLYFLGRSGEEKDIQQNLPGYRPKLDEPSWGEFEFEPEKLKSILSWPQQQRMVQELTQAAALDDVPAELSRDLLPSKASFYLFQCHLLEFGTTFNAQSASEWLLKTSIWDGQEPTDYIAQSCLWRVSQALGISLDLPEDKILPLLGISVMRGYRSAIEDMQDFVKASDKEAAQRWSYGLQIALSRLQKDWGSVGMGHFFSRYLTKEFNLDDLPALDRQIRAELGSNYDACVKQITTPTTQLTFPTPQVFTYDVERTAFDKIYINGRGHGILHYAAAQGKVTTLHHLITKYRCDVNLPNQSVEETPLVCACEAGDLKCTYLLLHHGANPNGHRFGQETPLHWLCSFKEEEMEGVAKKLISQGAQLERSSGGMRHDVRKINADWEHMFEVRVTPLGRAVWMRNLAAVRILLKCGADPIAKTGLDYEGKSFKVVSPLELAAALTLPTILLELINAVKGGTRPLDRQHFPFNERKMISMAHTKQITPLDSLSLQSRLIRCGKNYRSDLELTLRLLRHNYEPGKEMLPEAQIKDEEALLLCAEVALGNVDIVETLLKINYDPNGTPKHHPIKEAILLNHEAIFNLLIKYGADVNPSFEENDPYESTLHICARRPKTSRPGRFIADHLIKFGVPIQIPGSTTHPPIALAIINQNFDSATALLEAGADLNTTYHKTIDNSLHEITLLYELLKKHNGHTLSSLQYIFSPSIQSLNIKPDFIIDKTRKYSVLQILAMDLNFISTDQLTPQIQRLCIEWFKGREELDYMFEGSASALHFAAIAANLSMVSLLLEKGARCEGEDGGRDKLPVERFEDVNGRKFTPLMAAMLGMGSILDQVTGWEGWLFKEIEWRKIGDYEIIGRLLLAKSSGKVDREVKIAWEKVVERKNRVLEEWNGMRGERRGRGGGWGDKVGEGVIDLSVLGDGRGKLDEEFEGLETDDVPWDMETIVSELLEVGI